MTDIKVDLNRVTRKQFREFMARLMDSELSADEKDGVTAELGAIVITEWPFENKISVDGILSLGILDNKRVDDALTAAMEDLSSKN